MMVSNELLDYLGETYKAAYPEQPADILFVDYVENYVETTSKNVERGLKKLGVKRTIDKKHKISQD